MLKVLHNSFSSEIVLLSSFRIILLLFEFLFEKVGTTVLQTVLLSVTFLVSRLFKYSLLLVVKPKVYIATQPKCTKRCKQSSTIKHLLEVLLLVKAMCIGFTADFLWMNTAVLSVTSEPCHSSSRSVLSLKDSSSLLKCISF